MAFNLQDVLSLVEKIEILADHPETITGLENDNLRRRLREAGKKLSFAAEVPEDAGYRIMNTPLQLAATRVGLEKGIFKALAEANSSTLTKTELSNKTGIDPVLMKRLLRYYQSEYLISQPGDDAYSANITTKALTSAASYSGIAYFAEMIYPALMALPAYLRENGFENPTNPEHCPWHIGHKTDLSPFPWLQANPQHLENFLPWMAHQRDGLPNFFDALDFSKEFLSGGAVDESTPIFIDVGGAMGHQCVALREQYPGLKGRIILQEQPYVIDQVKVSPLPGFSTAGVEAEVYDMFTPQPIKGARTYYYRNVLHDWPNHKCKEILEVVKAAMTQDSMLLLDEMVLSERGAPTRAAQLDLAMLCCLAAAERTAAEWEALLSDAGFQIKKIWKYAEECEYCIIAAVPK